MEVLTIDRKRSFFKLYSHCIPVVGKEGAVIVNLQRANFTVIPLFLAEIVREYDNLSVEDLAVLYEDEEDSILRHFQELCKQQLGHFTSYPDRFPRMEIAWETPERVKLAVLEIAEYTRFDYAQVLGELESLLCKNMEIWFTGAYTFEEVEEMLSLIEDTVVRTVTLVMRYDCLRQMEEYVALRKKFAKIHMVYLYNAPVKVKLGKHDISAVREDFGDIRKKFTDVSFDEYIIYLEFFMESQQHNPYYNRKICIDGQGFIRNCLTHENHFGNINTHHLEEVYKDTAFRELWHACNDRVIELKDSEYRYVILNTHRLEKVDDHFYRIV